MHLDELIRWGGYFLLTAVVFAETGLLVGFCLPGDSLLVTAGLLAAVENSLNIYWLNLFLCLAAIIGDSVGYWIGCKIGPRIFTKEDSFIFNKAHITRTHLFFEKYGPKTLVLARFVPVVRTFAPTLAGVAGMNYKKFLSYNVVGGVAWVLSMTLLGYFLGRSIPDIEKKIHWVVLAVIFISFLPILNEWNHERKLRASGKDQKKG